MARKNSTRAAQGSGTIRKKTVTRNGKPYTYWEARVTTGRDPGTGKQIQRSFTGKTQKEVREKMQVAAVEVNQGTYTAPQRMTVGQWLDIWHREYLGHVKPATAYIYKNNIQNHIKPAIGAVQLADLKPHIVQQFINSMELAPSSIRLAYKVLHQALKKAVELEYIPKNPASGCVLPRMEQKEIHPLDDQQLSVLLKASQGTRLENIIRVALFAGLRQSEILGLTWDCVDLRTGAITVNKQLARTNYRKNGIFLSPKNGKARTVTAAKTVISALKAQKRIQAAAQLKAGPMWDNPYRLVFTDEIGKPLDQGRVEVEFSRIVSAAGLEGVRFHDTRHTYAVNSLRAGDDIKTIQGNLGHATAAFTLDRYGHFTDRMKQDSADRMEGFIKSVLGL